MQAVNLSVEYKVKSKKYKASETENAQVVVVQIPQNCT